MSVLNFSDFDHRIQMSNFPQHTLVNSPLSSSDKVGVGFLVGFLGSCLIGFLAILGVFCSALVIAELVIASQYIGHDGLCNLGFMTPVTWLQIDGIVGLVMVGLCIFVICCAPLTLIGLCFYGTFYLVWTILGAIIFLAK